MPHPNTVAGSVGGGAGVLVVYLLSLFHVHVDAVIGAAIATAGAAVVLFIGRNGLAGVWRLIMRGSSTPPIPPAPPAPMPPPKP